MPEACAKPAKVTRTFKATGAKKDDHLYVRVNNKKDFSKVQGTKAKKSDSKWEFTFRNTTGSQAPLYYQVWKKDKKAEKSFHKLTFGETESGTDNIQF